VKKIIPFLAVAMILAIMPFSVMNIAAENKNETSIDPDTLINYGYLQQFREELRQEIIDELLSEGGITVSTTYEDISLTEGQMLILSPNAEVIYRGGNAVAITSSKGENEGITDMSEEKELFSGEPLEYGHIYYASASDSRKAILVTGSNAYFTVRGDYELG